MKKKITLYNVIFPIYLILLIPRILLLILPMNFMIDSLVILIIGKKKKIENVMECYKKSILKVFLFGIISNVIGSLFMLIPMMIPSSVMQNKALLDIRNAIISNPFSNFSALIYVLLAILISMFCIYKFNLNISFKKLKLSNSQKVFLSLALMFITAPYTFLIPTYILL
ncbi:MAG: hypothetical protein IJ220_07615 [Clostridia bacterium]|nr:hypothetical protein [Clostridia bacterium]